MEKQGMNDEMARAYDAGYTNALMQLKNHINAFIDKPNSQTKHIFDLMATMLEVADEEGLKR
jgi:hypothetical protein